MNKLLKLSKLFVYVNLALLLFFVLSTNNIYATYWSDCNGDGIQQSQELCACNLCPGGGPYECPGGSTDRCLNIGCYCEAGECKWSGNTWSSCGLPPDPGDPDPDPGGGDPAPVAPTCSNVTIGGTPNLIIGETGDFAANITSSNAASTSISWSIDPLTPNVQNAIFTTATNVNPVTLRGAISGQDTLRVNVTVTNSVGSDSCNAQLNITVGPPKEWWQVKGGANVMTGSQSQNSKIVSRIPNSCTLAEALNQNPPLCRDEFIVEERVVVNGSPRNLQPGTVLSPGADLSPNSLDFRSSLISGGNANNINPGVDWIATTYYSGEQYSFDYFDNLTQGKIVYQMNPGEALNDAVENATVLNANNYINTDGYFYIKRNDESSIVTTANNGNINIGTKKVVVLLEGQIDFSDNTKITVTEQSNGFFLLAAKGDINVHYGMTTSNSSQNPYPLEGIYFTESNFNTGSCAPSCPGASGYDRQFSLNGSLVALGTINLERNLGDNNQNTPAESFVHEPAFIINFPTSLSTKNLFTREVNP